MSFLSRFQQRRGGEVDDALAIDPVVADKVSEDEEAKPTDWLESEVMAAVDAEIEAEVEKEVVPELELPLSANYTLDECLRKLVEAGGSDLHLTSGSPPIFRINGLMHRCQAPTFKPEQAETLLLPLANQHQIEHFEGSGNLDLAYEIKGVARFRCNFFNQHHGMGAVFRVVPSRMPTMEELDLPKVMKVITEMAHGLVIVTGPTGSGKSTTLAAMINEINSARPSHVITIEDPIEFFHTSKQALIDHREVGTHAISFADALRAAMREDPDILLVGEMRDLETVHNALKAAEMGVLVFATLHTNSAPKTVNRIIDIFPAKAQEQIKSMLGDSIKAVIAQQLLRRKDGSGRVAAHEIMMGGPGVSNLIRKGDMNQLTNHMHSARAEGNRTMDFALAELVRRNLVTKQAALERSQDPGELLKVIKSMEREKRGIQ